MKIKEELQEILDDHKAQIIDMLKEDAEEALVMKTIKIVLVIFMGWIFDVYKPNLHN